MSSHRKQRDAIRATWLNRTHWQFNQELELHFIFFLGTEKAVTLSKEEQHHMDILQSNFMESHYNLSIKDHDFFTSNKLYNTYIFVKFVTFS